MNNDVIYRVERGDTFRVLKDLWVILSVDILIIKKTETETTKRIWVCLSDQNGDLFDKQLGELLEIVNSEDVKYLGNSYRNADLIDTHILKVGNRGH